MREEEREDGKMRKIYNSIRSCTVCMFVFSNGEFSFRQHHTQNRLTAPAKSRYTYILKRKTSI